MFPRFLKAQGNRLFPGKSRKLLSTSGNVKISEESQSMADFFSAEYVNIMIYGSLYTDMDFDMDYEFIMIYDIMI